MEKIKIIIRLLPYFGVLLLVADAVLYYLGRRSFKENHVQMLNPEKEFAFYSLCPIGFGVLRLLPGLEKLIRVEAVSRLFRSRYDYDDEYRAYRRCFIASQLTVFLVYPLVGIAVIYAAYMRKMGKTSLLLMGGAVLAMYLMLLINASDRLVKGEKKRKKSIIDAMPDMLNRMVILLNSGMPMVSVFQKIGDMGEGTPLQNELKRVQRDISSSKDVVYAVSRMQRRCQCYEMNRLYGIVEAAVNKGARGAGEMLSALALELWKNKRNEIKTRSAKESMALLVPTTILLAECLVLLATPALMSMSSFSVGKGSSHIGSEMITEKDVAQPSDAANDPIQNSDNVVRDVEGIRSADDMVYVESMIEQVN